MDNKPKNREWVKTAAIIFLAILLVLTFFSNTILNRTLPQVSTFAVADGAITARVRATGKVSAIGNNEVKATGTRTIAAVKVKAGQEVNEGDVLFVMGSGSSEEIETAIEARDSAYYDLKSAQASYPIDSSSYSYNASYSSYLKLLAEEQDAWNQYIAASASLDNPEYARIAGELASARTKLEGDRQMLTTHRNDLQDSMNEQQAAFYDAYANWQNAQTEEERSLWQTICDNARFLYDQAEAEYNRSFTVADPYFSAVSEDEGMVASLEAQLSSFDSKASNLYSRYEAALKARLAGESSLASAEASYAASQASTGQAAAIYGVNVERAENTLEKKEAKLANLTGEGEDVNVYAKVGGIIETVNYSSGDTVTKDDVMCIIEVPDQGYTMTATVTKDQASRLKVGDEGSVANFYWGSTINAKITSIKADPTDPQGKRQLTFELNGDVTNGQELTVSVGSKSASYDIVVPKSAVMSDNNGNYVLVITSKSSALGNRYFAKRVDVEILAEDDSHKAISGDLGNGDFVITNSSTKINSGDQVRLADNA